MVIIIIHELGHLSAAMYYGWNIEKVIIMPFGGLTLFNEDINKPLKEEFLILIMGPLIQIIFTIFFKENIQMLEYSKSILLFNLLPIYPLDGSKILNILLNKLYSFKKSHIITIYISFIIIIFTSLKNKFNLIYMIIMFFLTIKVIEEFKNHNNIFNKFLLERYINNYNFKKYKIIRKPSQMKRDYRHYIKNGKTHITEREYLKKRFDFHR